MPITITINHIVSFSPAIEVIIMSRIDDLNAKLAAAQAAVDAEKAQGDALTAEITALKAQLENGLSSDDAAAVEAKIDDLTSKIAGIVTPDTPPAPAPEPTPAP
jgi:cell division protein FtsB